MPCCGAELRDRVAVGTGVGRPVGEHLGVAVRAGVGVALDAGDRRAVGRAGGRRDVGVLGGQALGTSGRIGVVAGHAGGATRCRPQRPSRSGRWRCGWSRCSAGRRDRRGREQSYEARVVAALAVAVAGVGRLARRGVAGTSETTCGRVVVGEARVRGLGAVAAGAGVGAASIAGGDSVGARREGVGRGGAVGTVGLVGVTGAARPAGVPADRRCGLGRVVVAPRQVASGSVLVDRMDVGGRVATRPRAAAGGGRIRGLAGRRGHAVLRCRAGDGVAVCA